MKLVKYPTPQEVQAAKSREGQTTTVPRCLAFHRDVDVLAAMVTPIWESMSEAQRDNLGMTQCDNPRCEIADCDTADCLASYRRHGIDVARDRIARRDYMAFDRPYDVPAEYHGTSAPDPMEGEKHASTTRRSNTGRTVEEVKRYGIADVIGRLDRDVNGRPVVGGRYSPNAIAVHLLETEARRRVIGVNTFDIDILTCAAYGDALEPLQGSTVRMFKTVRIGAQTDAYDSHTLSGGMRWPTRYAIPKPRLRKAEKDLLAIRPLVFDDRHRALPADSPLQKTTHLYVLTPLHAAAEGDRIWIGHRCITRLATQRRRTKLAARTVGTVSEQNMPTTSAGWAELAAMLSPGERVVIAYDGGEVRINCSPNGKYSVTDPRILVKGRALTFTARTTNRVGIKLRANTLATTLL